MHGTLNQRTLEHGIPAIVRGQHVMAPLRLMAMLALTALRFTDCSGRPGVDEPAAAQDKMLPIDIAPDAVGNSMEGEEGVYPQVEKDSNGSSSGGFNVERPRVIELVLHPTCSASFAQITLTRDTVVRFRSPNYPTALPRNTYCGWTFKSVGGRLRLVCPEVSLGVGDYFLLRDTLDGGRLLGTTDSQFRVVAWQFKGNEGRVGMLTGGGNRAARGFRCRLMVDDGPVSPTPSTANTPVAPATTTAAATAATVATTAAPTTAATCATVATTAAPTNAATSATVATTAAPTTTVPATTQAAVVVTGDRTTDCLCGLSVHSRIVGGSETERNEYPWVAALTYTSRGQYRVFCGASLISDGWVLTAAHCLVAIRQYRLITIHVLLGLHSAKDTNGSTVLHRTPRQYIVHPGYDNITMDNDIGLIRIDPVDFATAPESVRPVCLPDESRTQYNGALGVVAGWGTLTSGGPSSSELMDVTLPILSHTECRRLMGSEVTGNMLCAGVLAGGRDSCQGDSGGPMSVINEQGKFQQVGIVSWGYGCADPNKPGVYTRLANYLTWISAQTVGSKTCPRTSDTQQRHLQLTRSSDTN